MRAAHRLRILWNEKQEFRWIRLWLRRWKGSRRLRFTRSGCCGGGAYVTQIGWCRATIWVLHAGQDPENMHSRPSMGTACGSRPRKYASDTQYGSVCGCSTQKIFFWYPNRIPRAVHPHKSQLRYKSHADRLVASYSLSRHSPYESVLEKVCLWASSQHTFSVHLRMAHCNAQIPIFLFTVEIKQF